LLRRRPTRDFQIAVHGVNAFDLEVKLPRQLASVVSLSATDIERGRAGSKIELLDKTVEHFRRTRIQTLV
jgi:hypothetical protein